jgi:predicted enzyme related to lactoylglutathione lyase
MVASTGRHVAGKSQYQEVQMLKGLRGASIWSEDLTKTLLPFYRDTLGLAVGMEAPGFVLLGDPNGVSLALGTHSDVHGKNADPARHMVALDTDDCRGEVARLRAAGVEIVEDVNDVGNGMLMATLRDPEGNLVQLMQFA